jgi:pimeloyl-ACP methyl ester carboxylesterase
MRRPTDFRHARASLEGLGIHYVREGQGAPVLLLHGWPGFWWEWHRNIGELARDFDVIVPDMRGFGESDKPPFERIDLYHMDHAVEDTRRLLDHLGIEKAALVGHDFGAVLVHKFIRRYPSRVIKAAVINPIVPGFDELYLSPGNFHESWYAMFHMLDMAVDLVSSSRDACRIYFRHFLNHWSHDQTLFEDELLETYVDNYMKPGNIRGGFNFYRPPQPWDDPDRTISAMPMMFLQGLADPCIPSKWSDLVTRWYTNFSMEYVAEAGHFLMLEKPELLNERLRKFFAS